MQNQIDRVILTTILSLFKMHMKKKFLLATMLPSMLLLVAFAASASGGIHYLQGYDSVDNGEIRWGGSTQFSWEWTNAVNTWNAEGPINIAPDTWMSREPSTPTPINLSLFVISFYIVRCLLITPQMAVVAFILLAKIVGGVLILNHHISKHRRMTET